MKKAYENPVLETVRFFGNDVVTTSPGCACNVEGYDFGPGMDDEACPNKDSYCACTPDQTVNCT